MIDTITPKVVGYIISGLISILIFVVIFAYKGLLKKMDSYESRQLAIEEKTAENLTELNKAIVGLQTMQKTFMRELLDLKSELKDLWKTISKHTEKISKLEK